MSRGHLRWFRFLLFFYGVARFALRTLGGLNWVRFCFLPGSNLKSNYFLHLYFQQQRHNSFGRNFVEVSSWL